MPPLTGKIRDLLFLTIIINKNRARAGINRILLFYFRILERYGKGMGKIRRLSNVKNLTYRIKI